MVNWNHGLKKKGSWELGEGHYQEEIPNINGVKTYSGQHRLVVSCRCTEDGKVHVLCPDGQTPGLKNRFQPHPDGQHSLPPGP